MVALTFTGRFRITPGAILGTDPGPIANQHVIGVTLVAGHTVEVGGLVQ